MKILTIKSKRFGSRDVLLSDCDYDAVRKYKWFLTVSPRGGLLYAISKQPSPTNKRTLMHRFLMGITDPKVWIDHADRDTLNNQRSNLRVATPSQNAANRKCKNKTGFIGVKVKNRKINKYDVKVIINGEYKHVGVYPSLVAAAYAYNQAALKYHGEFASLNPVTAIRYKDGTMYTHEVKKPCTTPIKAKDFIIEQVRTFVPC